MRADLAKANEWLKVHRKVGGETALALKKAENERDEARERASTFYSDVERLTAEREVLRDDLASVKRERDQAWKQHDERRAERNALRFELAALRQGTPAPARAQISEWWEGHDEHGDWCKAFKPTKGYMRVRRYRIGTRGRK